MDSINSEFQKDFKLRSRRTFLQMSCLTFISALNSLTKNALASELNPTILTPTPFCDDNSPTPPQIEGPFYTPNSPQRNSLLESDITGTKIILTGVVFSSNCQPVANALLDFWHANDSGEYDTVGYQLRGHQFTDEKGRYFLETIVPGIYPGRTRHFHVKVSVPNQSLLTTQLFFPGERRNRRDRFFREELLMTIEDINNGKKATFNFVIA
jgi:protocatechuate 3,4-dioxygenase beta subunit